MIEIKETYKIFHTLTATGISTASPALCLQNPWYTSPKAPWPKALKHKGTVTNICSDKNLWEDIYTYHNNNLSFLMMKAYSKQTLTGDYR